MEIYFTDLEIDIIISCIHMAEKESLYMLNDIDDDLDESISIILKKLRCKEDIITEILKGI